MRSLEPVLNSDHRENQMKKVKMTFLSAKNVLCMCSHNHIMYICCREHSKLHAHMFAPTFIAYMFTQTLNICSCEHGKVNSPIQICDLANFFNFLRSTKVEPIIVGSPRYYLTTIERSKRISDTYFYPYDLLADTYKVRSQTISTK